MQNKPFKSPLRVEWERVAERMQRDALRNDVEGVMARALVAFSPALVEFMEGELRRATPPMVTLEAVTVAICNMAHKAIAATVERPEQAAALRIMHQLIERDVAPRLGFGRFPSARIFIPGSDA